jgi:DNA-binding PadR family transcriptional regulator
MWEISVLALLREAPMHPYQMQRLLRVRHKDAILVLKRGSLYHAIDRLERRGLIKVKMISREGKRPERTTYRITPQGLDALLKKLREIVRKPRRESSEFMAAMSFLIHLEPKEGALRLEERADALKTEIAELTTGLAAASTHVSRINLIESEYLLAMLKAELAWVRAMKKEIEEGTLTWDRDMIFRDVHAERNQAGDKEK